MSDALIELPAASLPVALADERDAAMAFADAALSAATRASYRCGFATFSAWCRERGFMPMPALPEVIAMFLSSQAHSGIRVSTLGCRLAAIRYAHKLAGHTPPPTDAEIVRTVMRGIRRSIGASADRKTPATADTIMAMLKLCPTTLRGRRDRALLALGFAGAFRRSELVALHVHDLQPAPDGLRVMIRRSKTDQEAEGQEIAIPRGAYIRPVEAVETWLDAAAITEGPVFRPVLKGHRVQDEALTDRSVALIVKRYADGAGFDPAIYAGHSLRSGFLTTAAEAGASIFKMMDHSRHKSVDTLRAYVRSAELFREHAGAKFL